MNEPLMTCRYCLLHELGHCRKVAPYPHDKEPRYLRLANGTQVELVFDCAKCEMRVVIEQGTRSKEQGTKTI